MATIPKGEKKTKLAKIVKKLIAIYKSKDSILISFQTISHGVRPVVILSPSWLPSYGRLVGVKSDYAIFPYYH